MLFANGDDASVVWIVLAIENSLRVAFRVGEDFLVFPIVHSNRMLVVQANSDEKFSRRIET